MAKSKKYGQRDEFGGTANIFSPNSAWARTRISSWNRSGVDISEKKILLAETFDLQPCAVIVKVVYI